jgi:hypothetical protein
VLIDAQPSDLPVPKAGEAHPDRFTIVLEQRPGPGARRAAVRAAGPGGVGAPAAGHDPALAETPRRLVVDLSEPTLLSLRGSACSSTRTGRPASGTCT